MKDVIIQTFFRKTVAKLANRNDQLFQNNSDFELLTKALKNTFFFFTIKKIGQEIMSNKGGEVIVSF